MFTYEVNLLCDSKNCDACITSTAHESSDAGVKETVEQAKLDGWKREKTKWYCPNHVIERWRVK